MIFRSRRCQAPARILRTGSLVVELIRQIVRFDLVRLIEPLATLFENPLNVGRHPAFLLILFVARLEAVMASGVRLEDSLLDQPRKYWHGPVGLVAVASFSSGSPGDLRD